MKMQITTDEFLFIRKIHVKLVIVVFQEGIPLS